MDEDNTGLDNLLEECQKHGIPVIKKNGQMYTHNTLLKKLKTARSSRSSPSNKMRGGAARAAGAARAVGAAGAQNQLEQEPGVEGTRGKGKVDAELSQYVKISDTLLLAEFGELGMHQEAMEEEFELSNGSRPSRTSKGSRVTNTKGSKVLKPSKASGKSRLNLGKVNDELLENPLGSKLDFHVDYEMNAKGHAILEDPLIQAYFNRIGTSKIVDSSEIPVGLAMAVYGNHAQLGDSGLSKRLPNVLENPKLQEFWDSKGVKKVTPQTMIPVRFLYLV